MRVTRLLPLSGIVFVVLVLLAIVAIGGNTPDSDASAAKVHDFYLDHDVQQALAAFVLAAAVPFLVLFGVALALAVWPSGDVRRPIWEVVLIAGAGLAAGAFLVAAFIHFALADGADVLSAEASQTLNVLDGDSWVAFNGALGVMMLGAGGSLLPTAVFRWLGWAALVLGVALFVPFADFFALLLTGIWIIVVSVLLYRGAGAAHRSAAPQAA